VSKALDRPGGRRGGLSHEVILEVAAGLFHTQGYRATSLAQVAAHFGAQRPAIYYYFPNKVAILIEIHDRLLRALTEQLDEIRADVDISPAEKLERIVRGQVELYAKNISALAVFIENEAELPPKEMKRARAEKRRYGEAIEAIYIEGVAAGSFADLDPKVVISGLSGLTGWMYRWYSPDGKRSPDEVAEILLGIVRGGLAT
jgi:AcrR family transcriptional regulator